MTISAFAERSASSSSAYNKVSRAAPWRAAQFRPKELTMVCETGSGHATRMVIVSLGFLEESTAVVGAPPQPINIPEQINKKSWTDWMQFGCMWSILVANIKERDGG